MDTEQFIAAQPADRQPVMRDIHDIILELDKTVTPVVAPMMGKDMIIYNYGTMKYGLASVAKYMSLHVLPMYMNPAIYDKYKVLLPNAAFQKGCINFTNAKQMPLNIVRQLITDCAPIDLLKMREEILAERKAKRKA